MRAFAAAAQATEPAQQPASIVEAARLACAAAGEQILAANAVRSAAYQGQFSRYSPRTNRCYVEMQVETLAASAHADRVGRFLYDGQTQELLAFAQIRDGMKSGRVFDMNHRTTTSANNGFDDARDYIDGMMAGEE